MSSTASAPTTAQLRYDIDRGSTTPINILCLLTASLSQMDLLIVANRN